MEETSLNLLIARSGWGDTNYKTKNYVYSLTQKLQTNISKLNAVMKRKTKEVKVTQLCPTHCDHMNCIVDGILQVRILEWVALPFSRDSSQPRDRTQVSRIAGGSLPAETQGKS